MKTLNLLLVALTLTAWTATPAAAQREASPPNILLILVDDLGFGDLSCYGSRQIQTPHIDALAAQGVRATHGYVSSAVCGPSRAGLLTGRYQNRFGFDHNPTYDDHILRESIAIPRDERLISDRLSAVGYRTACIGKWHVGKSADWHLPNARGFDYFFGMLKGNHNYFPKADNNQLSRNGEPVTEIEEPYLTDWFTTEALDFIDQTPEGEPWFVFLSYNTPHTPMQAKQEDIDRFKHIPNKTRQIYCAMQYCLDQNIGRISKHLRDSGQWDNTLIVFLSDNGGPCTANASINAPLRGQKGTVLEGGFRVPMIFTWPDRLPAGVTYPHPVSSLDLMATFMESAGHPFTGDGDKTYDSVSLLPYLTGKDRGRPHDEIYIRILMRGAALRVGDWKLVRVPHRMPEIYNLAKDPGETRNLAAREPKRVNQMMRALHDWEVSLERNPMWISEPHWGGKNRALYDREYIMVQPD